LRKSGGEAAGTETGGAALPGKPSASPRGDLGCRYAIHHIGETVRKGYPNLRSKSTLAAIFTSV